MSRRAKKNAARAVLGAVLLAMALFALLPFVYMGLVSLTQKTVLDLRFDPAEFSFKNYARVFSNFNIGRNLLNSVIVTGGACSTASCAPWPPTALQKIIFRGATSCSWSILPH